jgi:DNA-binding GntR family transcriptional regulator
MNGVSLRERVKNSIQDDILSGRLKPGDKLDEQLIATRNKASRTPVREAINQLAMNGLIELHENRGAFVSRISVTQVIHMFEVLNVLEATCARYAAQRITDRELQNLKKLCDKGLALAERKDLDAYAAYNRAFHKAVYEATHNPFFEEVTMQIRTRLAPYRRESFKMPRRMEVSAREHAQIVEGIAAGDPDKVATLMAQHTNLLKDDFSSFLLMLSRMTEGENTPRAKPAKTAKRKSTRRQSLAA